MLLIKVDGEEFEYDDDRLMNTEAKAIQGWTGMRLKAWEEACNEGDADALTALIWLIRKRSGRFPDLRFADVEFNMASLEIVDPADEAQAAAAAAAGGEVGPTEAASAPSTAS